MDIAYHLTSTQTKPNKTMRTRVLPFFLAQGVERVLDYGCGKYLRDSLLLADAGLVVSGVELEEQVKLISAERAARLHRLSTEIVDSGYDAVLLNFVLQVLPSEMQRQSVMEKVCGVAGRYLVLSLRNQRDMRHCVEGRGVPFNDGFIMQRNGYRTFVRGYDRKEVEELLDSHGLDVLEMYRTSDAYIALGEKK